MKYLIISLLFIFSSASLVAQDTLYLKGKKDPLLVEVKVTNKKYLDYTFLDSDSIVTIALRKVRRVKFAYDNKEKIEEKTDSLIPKREKFRSVALIQSVFVGRQTQFGPNYMYRISSDTTERMNIWVQFGGGYHRQHSFRRDTKGHYWELGARFELISRRDSKNCFHTGFDINQQWAKGKMSGRGINVRSTSNANRVEDEGLIAVQIPIGYTHRADNGLYISGGLEVTVHYEFFFAFNLSIGYCFLK